MTKICRFCWKPVSDSAEKCPNDECTVFFKNEEELREWARKSKKIFIKDGKRLIINLGIMEIDKYYKFEHEKKYVAKLNKDNSLEIKEEE